MCVCIYICDICILGALSACFYDMAVVLPLDAVALSLNVVILPGDNAVLSCLVLSCMTML